VLPMRRTICRAAQSTMTMSPVIVDTAISLPSGDAARLAAKWQSQHEQPSASLLRGDCIVTRKCRASLPGESAKATGAQL